MRYSILIMLLLGTYLPSSYAFEANIPESIPQGKTIEIEVATTESVESIEGTVDRQVIRFFPQAISPTDEASITRGEFLYLLFNNTRLPRSGVGEMGLFPDVDTSSSYSSAIYSARTLGIIHGYEDGSFYPDETLTRAQAAKILTISFGLEQKSIDNEFSDLDSTHSLYIYLMSAISNDLFRGYGDGTVKPDRSLRYDEAEILLRRLTDKDSLTPRPERTSYIGYLGFHRINDTGNKTITLKATYKDKAEKVSTHNILVTKQRYPTTSFNLPPSKTDLFAQESYNRTWAMIDGAKQSPITTPLWNGAFIIPTKGEVSMGFGDTVYINGALSGSHFGIDYANSTGTPIYASNNGTVTLSAYTPSYGNTIIIDHGANIYTMYMHMSALHVAEGDSVIKGDLIGEIGATGIATGPHLHFTHFIGNIIVDSQEWFDGKF